MIHSVPQPCESGIGAVNGVTRVLGANRSMDTRSVPQPPPPPFQRGIVDNADVCLAIGEGDATVDVRHLRKLWSSVGCASSQNSHAELLVFLFSENMHIIMQKRKFTINPLLQNANKQAAREAERVKSNSELAFVLAMTQRISARQ